MTDEHGHTEFHEPRTAADQAKIQLAGIAVTLIIAVAGGILTGNSLIYFKSKTFFGFFKLLVNFKFCGK